MASNDCIGQDISDLKASVAKYENELDCASSAQERSEIRQLITSARETLNILLLDEKKVRYMAVGAKLRDGIPLLQQNLTLSPPSVPSEKEHASCYRI